MKVRQRSLKPPPKSRPGSTGPTFGWRRGVHWLWQRVRVRDYLPQYFSFWTPFSFVLSSALSPCPCPRSHLGYLIFFYFLGAVPVASSQFPVAGGGTPGDQQPPTSGVFSGWIRGWGPVQYPLRGHDPARSFHICWPPSAQGAHVGANCYGLMPNSTRGQSSPTVPWPLGGNTPAEMTPCRGCPLGLSLPGQGVPWGTLILPCCHLFSCVLHPSGHEAVMSPFSPLHSLIPVPSDSIASGYIALDLWN